MKSGGEYCRAYCGLAVETAITARRSLFGTRIACLAVSGVPSSLEGSPEKESAEVEFPSQFSGRSPGVTSESNPLKKAYDSRSRPFHLVCHTVVIRLGHIGLMNTWTWRRELTGRHREETATGLALRPSWASGPVGALAVESRLYG